MTSVPRFVGEFRLTNHARLRIGQMADAAGLTLAEIHEALTRPEVEFGADRPDREGQRTRQAGRIAVVIDPAARVVITVLWRTQRTYVRPEKRRGDRR